MYGCQQVLVKKDNQLVNILTFLCEESHKLTNMGIYYGRQLYFKAQKGIGKFDLIAIYKNNNHYKVLHSQAAQQTLLSVAESFKSYYGLVKAYKKGKILDRPRIPNYRKKGGLAVVSYPKQALKLKGNKIRVPLGKTCKRWFALDSFLISMARNLSFAKLKELRIIPRNQCFYLEFVYKKDIEKPNLSSRNILGIDPGLNNWLTCVSNVETSFIIDGKKVKSMNRWYNKQMSNIKENIQFLESEESYTSKASFLDGDYLPTYGEKPKDWKPSGKRTKRGLYRTANNWYINADCNGAAYLGFAE